MKILSTIILIITGLTITVKAQDLEFFKAVGTPVEPKVEISWNRYYTYEGIEKICKEIAASYPNFAKVSSLGKSYQGREIWMLTITNFTVGKELEKPAFYIDGNIHSNEIQGAEVAMYTAWYLTESVGSNDFIGELLEDKVFYIVPTINPDARMNYMEEANTPHSPRSGMIPIDDDRDGFEDEDGYDDLNNDGHITMMRRETPLGEYIVDPQDSRKMIRVKPGKKGTHEILGYEGIDNDGDGSVNEDRVGGYYDPNRDWAWNWQPDHIQNGAYKYPFSVPENRVVADFFLEHPNIAGAQSYHNSGGMLLRGPGAAEDQSTYDRADSRVYDLIGKTGAKLLPGYRYMIIYKDLYTTFGGEIEWFHGGRGVFSFTNELYSSYLMFHEKDNDNYDFEELLLHSDAFVEWEEYDHPQYGKVEIGGFKKNFGRANPGFLLETDAHRNMSFTLFHAWHTPKLSIDKVEIEKLKGGLKSVTATITNNRLIPTHSSHDVKNNIERPDYISISGSEVLAGMQVLNEDLNKTKEQKYTPEKLEIDNIPGMSSVKVRWIVAGNRKTIIDVNSAKGGTAIWEEE